MVESTRKQFAAQLANKEAEIAKREIVVQAKQTELIKAQEDLQTQLEAKLQTERVRIADEELKKAKQLLAVDLETKSKQLSELNEVLKQRDDKLAQALKGQADLMRRERELQDEKHAMELTIEKRIQESLGAAREKAKKEAEDELKLKVTEKEQTILSMQRQIEELKRRAEQGSQQLQGEAQEILIEEMLRSRFPHDLIEPVPKGEFGGDTLHRVCTVSQQICGTILWEFKRTKNWSESWLVKLREDQRTAKAEIAVMVSQQLPKEVDTFDYVDGVWVTSPKHFIPVAVALRHTLLELFTARIASEGQQTKQEIVYQYLTGSRFRQRMQAIVEAFTSMQEDLNKERKVITKQWAKREEQIDRVMQATVGMYGDLQGIAGKTLQEIEGLEMGALEGAEINITDVN